ncbi:MAG: hypothetical protein ACXV6L_08160, partial [Halobacteriota archaeon]
MKDEYDVIVVEVGPAGSIAARAAAEECVGEQQTPIHIVVAFFEVNTDATSNSQVNDIRASLLIAVVHEPSHV